MKDSTALILAGVLFQFLVLASALVSTSILPLATFSIIGIALLGCGFTLLASDK